MTSEPVRRTANPHVDFLCAGFAKIYDARARCRSANDRIIHYYHALTFHCFLDEVQFYAHVEIADQLTGLEKGAPDIVIPDKRVFVRNAEFVRESERGVVTRVWYGHHDVRFDRIPSRQLASHLGADLSDIDAAHDAIRSREINVLEHAKRFFFLAEWPFRANAFVANDDHFARPHLPNVFGVDEIERARFRRQDVSVIEFAENERPETKRIAHTDDLALAHYD